MTTPAFDRVILIEDEVDVREAARLTLELEGFRVAAFSRAEPALETIDADFPGVVISDVKMPGMDGLELLQRVCVKDRELPVILVTGHGDISMAIQAVRKGAYDFIEKPVAPERLVEEVKRALNTRRLVLENRGLKRQLAGRSSLESRVIGNSAGIIRLREMIRNVADADIDVLIHGETGTGKELVARALHDFSKRREGHFVALNCGALPETVIESELFGHEAGAFTGASKRRIGKIEYADGGTLFLDELESMPMHLQIKLLRVLQERSLERLGGNQSIPVNVRVVAATKSDLFEAAARGEFREDLYYRLNVALLQVPSLRERLDDVPLLFTWFVSQSAQRLEREAPALAPEQLSALLAHRWPGNVRELQHEAERFVLGISQLLAGAPNASTQSPEREPGSLPEQMESFEKRLLTEALTRTRGRVTEAAERLGIPRKKLYLRLQKFGIDKERFVGG
ncbi:sigma-54 dependent transcriptional regulator [Motiliproteus sp. SC1-56]|uniref:sigma-54-dependent transcriptional regulator n=1 Tax=Motiliproteus sp. SC1-56 TaxID=2799565 RepID=UPI001A90B56D|nr:sigma-54 dependent transcriptional regulator [Motiliproteus sp. SC1-56]